MNIYQCWHLGAQVLARLFRSGFVFYIFLKLIAKSFKSGYRQRKKEEHCNNKRSCLSSLAFQCPCVAVLIIFTNMFSISLPWNNSVNNLNIMPQIINIFMVLYTCSGSFRMRITKITFILPIGKITFSW